MNQTFIERPPRTILEVFKMLPGGTLAEIIDNQLYIFVFGSAVYIHQRTLMDLFSKLTYINDQGIGKIILRPLDIYLDEVSNVVQPDVAIILNSNPAKINPKDHYHGVPDIIVEILTDGYMDYDLIKKKTLYQKFCVKEYWVIEPEAKLVLNFELKDNGYVLTNESIGLIRSNLLNASIKLC